MTETRDRIRPGAVILLSGLLAMLGSCSIAYDDEALGMVNPREVPDLTMDMVNHSIWRDGRAILTLEAERVEVYNAQRRRVSTGVRFFQYDLQGGLVARGSAQGAVQDLKDDTVALEGPIVLEIPGEDATVEAEALQWNGADKTFSGPADGMVRLRRTDGTYIQGVGFSLDALGRAVRFDGPTEGVIVGP